MKKIYYIVFAILVSGLLDACIHDDTSLADPDFSGFQSFLNTTR